MANFNFGIDCPTEDSATGLHAYIEGLDFYRDGLDVDEERVSLVSKQGLLEELKAYASRESVELSVEVWPEDSDYDEAEESGDLEVFDYS